MPRIGRVRAAREQLDQAAGRGLDRVADPGHDDDGVDHREHRQRRR